MVSGNVISNTGKALMVLEPVKCPNCSGMKEPSGIENFTRTVGALAKDTSTLNTRSGKSTRKRSNVAI